MREQFFCLIEVSLIAPFSLSEHKEKFSTSIQPTQRTYFSGIVMVYSFSDFVFVNFITWYHHKKGNKLQLVKVVILCPPYVAFSSFDFLARIITAYSWVSVVLTDWLSKSLHLALILYHMQLSVQSWVQHLHVTKIH